MTADDCTVRRTRWAQHGAELARLREIVFVQEQGVPEELEIDEHDPDAWHVMICDPAEQAIATGRLLKTGHIGRVAVLKQWRGQGLGKRVMQALLALAAEQKLPQALLHAQVDAIGFYRNLGFHPQGAVFMDAGIPHQTMILPLTGTPPGPGQ